MSRASRARTPELDLSYCLGRVARSARAGQYPLTRYQADPVAYAFERLHIEQLLPHQIEILRSMADGIAGTRPARVAVRSGQKCAKTKTAIIAALWFYECFAKARVFLCAAIETQTKNVLWKELTDTIREARAAGSDLDGNLATTQVGGFVSTDGSREVKGVSGREIESIAGLSGNQLTIIDEASALPPEKAQVFDGNQMGGGAMLFISNPTRNSGPFYDAFHTRQQFWQTFHLDSESVAQWCEQNGVRIKGVASLERIAEFREMYGEQSAFWQLRVKGQFLRNETGRAIPMYKIEDALNRWVETPEEGHLSIGYDPAGPGDGGDEHAWSAVRGRKLVAIFRKRGLDEAKAVAETLSILRLYRRDGDAPRITIDAEGPIGSAIYGLLRAESERCSLHDRGNAFEVYGCKSGSKFVRDATKFERVRDELVWSLAEWMTDGALPRDDKLQSELHEPVWSSLPGGQIKSTPKSQIREKLGRSPDSFDSLALAVRGQQRASAPETTEEHRPGRTDTYQPVDEEMGRGMARDPYGDLTAMQRAHYR